VGRRGDGDREVGAAERLDHGPDEAVVSLLLARRRDQDERAVHLVEPGHRIGSRLPDSRTDQPERLGIVQPGQLERLRGEIQLHGGAPTVVRGSGAVEAIGSPSWRWT